MHPEDTVDWKLQREIEKKEAKFKSLFLANILRVKKGEQGYTEKREEVIASRLKEAVKSQPTPN